MLKKIVAVPALVAAALFSGAAVANTTTPPATTAPDKATFKGADASNRDWSQLDTNKDHSISPEEMRKWMEANTEWGKAATKRN